VTDPDGRFRLEPVAPGSYLINAFAPGFVGPSDNPLALERGKVVMVTEGENVEGIALALQRGGVITGRITEAGGLPIVSATVDLYQLDEAGRSRPRSTLVTDGSMYVTDDRGVYRIYGLAAGLYKLAVGTVPGNSVSRFSVGYYPRTFYPDAADDSRAIVVKVDEGSEVGNVDIAVRPFAKTYNVAGRIIDAGTGAPLSGLLYGYGAIGTNGDYNGSRGVLNTRSTSNGNFLINGLTPGRYAAFVVNEDNSESYSEPAVFDLTNSDISGVEVKVHRGASISGVAVIEGTPDGVPPVDLSRLAIVVDIFPKALEGVGMATPRVSSDGQFYVSGLRPGLASVSVRLLPVREKQTVTLARIERDGIQQGTIEIKEGEQVTGVRLVLHYVSGSVQ